MQGTKPQQPSRTWKDLEDWHRHVKERTRRCYRKIEAWVSDHQKLKLLFHPRAENTLQSPPSASQPRKTVPRAESWLPDEPIHNCELDIETGEYYCPHCPFGSGPVATDPWKAMIHEVAHFAEPEEVEEMRKEYETKLVAQEEDESEDPLPDTATTNSRPTKIRLISMLIVISTCLFGWLVWPTPYRYDHLILGPASYPVRISRLTGRVDILKPSGWEPSPDQSNARLVTLNPGEIGELKAQARIDPASNFLKVSLYNGSSYTLKDVTAEVKVYATTGAVTVDRPYHLFGEYGIGRFPPEETAHLMADLGFGIEPGQYWTCDITAAKGTKVK